MSLKRIGIFTDDYRIKLIFEYLKSIAIEKKWSLEFEELSDIKSIENYDLIQTDVESCAHFSKLKLNIPSNLSVLDCADIILCEQNHWWPKLLMLEAFKRLMINQVGGIDIKKAGFVIGINKLQRVVTSILIGAGYAKIYLVDQDINSIQEEIHYLKKKFFNVEFQALPEDQLTLQTQNATCLVVATDLSQNQLLSTDLSYFNFLFPNSFVADFNLFPLDSHLLQEARRVKMRTLEASQIFCEYGFEILNLLNPSPAINRADFEKNWMEFIKTQSKV